MWRETAHTFSVAVLSVALLGLTAIGALPTIKSQLAELQKKKTVVVRDIDPGGSVGTYDMFWHRIADSGVMVVIDGDCISACALVMGIVPPERICLTDRAVFGLHMASMPNPVTGQREPNKGATEWMIRRYYPPVVVKWIEAQGGLKEDVIYMKPADFKGYYRQCNKEDYNPWPTESSR